MTTYRSVFIGLLVLAVALSATAAFPLTNVLMGNPDGWFTMQNIDAYGDDLDERAAKNGGELIVMTGHPSYVMHAEDARLLWDMPRSHYYAKTYKNSVLGDRYYANLTRAYRNGEPDFVIEGTMTRTIHSMNHSAAQAYQENYCLVDDEKTVALYARTSAELYRYDPDCPADKQPVINAPA